VSFSVKKDYIGNGVFPPMGLAGAIDQFLGYGIVAVFGFILTIIGSWISIRKGRHDAKDKRIKDFALAHKSVAKGRDFYTGIMKDVYRTDDDVGGYLLVRSDWEQDKLRDLGELRIESKGCSNSSRPQSDVELKQDPFCPNRRSSLDAEDMVNLNSFRWPPLPDRKIGYAENARMYLDRMLFDGPTYRVTDICAKGGEMVIDVCRSDYYAYYDTCEYLLYLAVYSINKKFRVAAKECRRVRRINGHVTDFAAYEKRPQMTSDDCRKDAKACHYRDSVYRLKDPFDLRTRSVGIGCDTLTVIKTTDGKFFFLALRRSDKVVEAINMVSSTPAGRLIYEAGGKGSELIKKNILRQFEEEVLGVSEVGNVKEYDSLRVNRTGIKFKLLGMGLDPLTTKLELLTCMIIDCGRSDLFGSNVKTKEDISKMIKKSHKGETGVFEFKEDNLRLHMNNERSMPLFREMMKYALKFFEKIIEE
jgi:hypothetical protein